MSWLKNGLVRRKSTGVTTAGPATRAWAEPLETRTMLAIDWVNRGPNDNFDAIYGTNANLARQIVDRAIDDWERVITNFNYADGSNTFFVNLSAADLEDGVRGSTDNIFYDAQRKPVAATIQLDDRAGAPDGVGENWYFDPVPADDAEYGALLSPFTANSTTTNTPLFDFYRTAAHEIGHALGLTIGAGLAIDNFTFFTPYTDVEGPLFAFNPDGGAVNATFTNSRHLFAGAPPAGSGLPTHPNDLMNPGYTIPNHNRRQLISDTDATILRDAYNYTITLPSTINTFHANLNASTGELVVSGAAGTVHDTILVDRDASGRVRVRVANTTETFAPTSVFRVTVFAGAGSDIVNLTGTTQPATVHGQEGNDNITGGSANDDLRGYAGDDTIRGGTGQDIISGDFGNDSLYGDGGDDNLLGGTEDDWLQGGPGEDELGGGSGSDTADFSDQTSGWFITLDDIDNDWVTAGATGRENVRSDVEIVVGSPFADSITGQATSVNNTFYGGGGNDTLSGGPGDDTLRGNTGNDTLFGGANNDTLWGDEGADTLDGGMHGDTLYGGIGNDILTGGRGADTLFGNEGADTFHTSGDAGDGDDILWTGPGPGDNTLDKDPNDKVDPPPPPPPP